MLLLIPPKLVFNIADHCDKVTVYNLSISHSRLYELFGPLSKQNPSPQGRYLIRRQQEDPAGLTFACRGCQRLRPFYSKPESMYSRSPSYRWQGICIACVADKNMPKEYKPKDGDSLSWLGGYLTWCYSHEGFAVIQYLTANFACWHCGRHSGSRATLYHRWYAGDPIGTQGRDCLQAELLLRGEADGTDGLEFRAEKLVSRLDACVRLADGRMDMAELAVMKRQLADTAKARASLPRYELYHKEVDTVGEFVRVAEARRRTRDVAQLGLTFIIEYGPPREDRVRAEAFAREIYPFRAGTQDLNRFGDLKSIKGAGLKEAIIGGIPRNCDFERIMNRPDYGMGYHEFIRKLKSLHSKQYRYNSWDEPCARHYKPWWYAS
ncbi:hypothetical protein BZA05DRAFT_409458 [Tricharina praecox]|uniref:uncharacterized protein n=1 Tax=Tricharina praecox TaxID=43433 RepID=UPI00221E3BEF|nr:uncharacterized protein BZA05DRAFT_409458 [Tricharina praecox]KAI5844225.1 hypothetical protein BZA05DRAFT_409458 [Tricharina praecox]